MQGAILISIFDQRYRSDGKPRAQSKADLTGAISRLWCGVVGSINRYVLTGDGNAPLRQSLDQVKDSLLQAGSAEEISKAEADVSGILAKYRGETQQAGMVQAIEVQHIFAMLNNALIVMAEGSERSVSRLSEIHNTLQRTANIRDMVAMKTALADAVKFVEKEAAESHKAVNEEMARLQTEVGKTREHIGKTQTDLAGRPEGVARISETLERLVPVDGQALYALACVCGRLSGIAQRYGAQVAEELVFHVIRERLEPVARAASLFRWTPSGLVAVFERRRDLKAVEREVAAVSRTPVVHRVALGSRVAVLTMSPSRLVLEGCPGSAAMLVDQLDQFIATCS
jgi:hypothetical protein